MSVIGPLPGEASSGALHIYSAIGTGPLSASSCRYSGCRDVLVSRLSCTGSDCSSHRLRRAVRRRTLAVADGVVGVSKVEAELLSAAVQFLLRRSDPAERTDL